LGLPYRAVDKAGRTVNFFLSRNRDVTAAKTFLRIAMKNRGTPSKITLDAYAAWHRAVREMKETGELPRRVKVRSSQYLNNLVEQDPPPNQTADSADARIQTIRPRGRFRSFAVVSLGLGADSSKAFSNSPKPAGSQSPGPAAQASATVANRRWSAARSNTNPSR
jgi:hypothetical protein